MDQQGEYSSKIAVLEAACRQHGLPLTVQRRVILEALAGRDDHPTADEIWEAVRVRLPEVSRTTVYRVLEALVRLGLAVRICSPGTGARFEPRTHRHDHLVCVECELVMDVEAPTLNTLPLPDVRKHAFEIHDFSTHFRGLCANCRRRSADTKKGTRRAPIKPKGRAAR
jgi:Fur family peroxide stress response transcriptional regulator